MLSYEITKNILKKNDIIELDTYKEAYNYLKEI